MLFKILLSLILLFLAYGLVVWLLKRLTDTTQRLADLQSQLVRNDEVLNAKLEALQQQKRSLEEQRQAEPGVEQPGAQTRQLAEPEKTE